MERNLRPYLVELIGTFAVVFLSAGAVCVNDLAAIAWQPERPAENPVIVQPEPGLIGIALAYGIAYATALAIVLPWSDGYLNPAMPLALWVFKRIDTFRAFALIGVQLLGAAVAGGALRLIFSFREDILTTARLGTPHVNLRMFERGGVTAKMLLSGIGMELVLSFLLAFALYALFIDPRAERWRAAGRQRWACIWIGLLVVALTLVGYLLTGAALNPARWFGTVIWENSIPSLHAQQPFQDHVVYWFGPITGALIAALLYSLLLPEAETAPVEESTRPRPASKH
jgi:glycerol uptake facilitator-like aquaporin